TSRPLALGSGRQVSGHSVTPLGNPSGTARARLAPPGWACSDPPGATRLYVKWSCPNRGPLAGGGELVEELVGEQRGPQRHAEAAHPLQEGSGPAHRRSCPPASPPQHLDGQAERFTPADPEPLRGRQVLEAAPRVEAHAPVVEDASTVVVEGAEGHPASRVPVSEVRHAGHDGAARPEDAVGLREQQL